MRSEKYYPPVRLEKYYHLVRLVLLSPRAIRIIISLCDQNYYRPVRGD